MKVEGTKTFEAPQAKVWEVLNDPARMAKTMPGVQSFEVQDDKHWKANVVIPLGLGGLKMSINFEKTEELRICRWCNFRSVCRPELAPFAAAAPLEGERAG